MEIKIRACDRCPMPAPGEIPARTTPQVFNFDGRRVQIDLCAEHTTAFLDDWDRMAEYMEHARAARSSVPSTVGHAVERRAQRQEKPYRHDNDRVRQWALEQGIEVSAKGRVPSHILKAYEEAAHGVRLGEESGEQEDAKSA